MDDAARLASYRKQPKGIAVERTDARKNKHDDAHAGDDGERDEPDEKLSPTRPARHGGPAVPDGLGYAPLSWARLGPLWAPVASASGAARPEDGRPARDARRESTRRSGERARQDSNL